MKKLLAKGVIALMLVVAVTLLDSWVYADTDKKSLAVEQAKLAKIRIDEKVNAWRGKPIQDIINLLGYPAEEKRILDKHLILWRNVGPEVDRRTYLDQYGAGMRGVMSYVGAANVAMRNLRGPLGEDERVKFKPSCELTVEIDQQKRVVQTQVSGHVGWCANYLGVPVVSLEELEKRQKEQRKKQKKIGVAQCDVSTLPSQQPSIHKIAVFPSGSDDDRCFGQGSRSTNEQIASILSATIRNNGSLKLVYSYYGKGPDNLLRDKIDDMWLGGTRGKPNSALISTLGEQIGADAVLMSWRPAAGVGYCTNRVPPFPIRLYLIDVDSQCALSVVDGEEEHLKMMIEQLFTHAPKGPGARFDRN